MSSGSRPKANEANDANDGPLTAIASFITPIEAYVLQTRLQAEGINAVVADAETIQMNQLLAPALGGVRVLVPQGGLARAYEIKAAISRGDFAIDDDFDVGTGEP